VSYADAENGVVRVPCGRVGVVGPPAHRLGVEVRGARRKPRRH
jgi:hypothetical protein